MADEDLRLLEQTIDRVGTLSGDDARLLLVEVRRLRGIVAEAHRETPGLVAENERLREALERISRLGRVCPAFDTCTHPACSDSAGAVLYALEALRACPEPAEGGRTGEPPPG